MAAEQIPQLPIPLGLQDVVVEGRLDHSTIAVEAIGDVLGHGFIGLSRDLRHTLGIGKNLREHDERGQSLEPLIRNGPRLVKRLQQKFRVLHGQRMHDCIKILSRNQLERLGICR